MKKSSKKSSKAAIRKRNPADLPRPTKSLPPRWLRKKLPEHYKELEVHNKPTQKIDLSHLGIRPLKKIPETINDAFDLGRLLGIKRGLDCKHIKYAKNIYKILLGTATADEFFNKTFSQLDKYEAFRSGIIFGINYSIKFCGLTNFLYRKQELEKVNRELAQKFWEYL